jgi:membrane protein YdbS with pleckstrin-like domain
MVVMEDESRAARSRQRRGYLNPHTVRAVSFWTTSACILVAVVASLLAIWQFAGTDTLWRTVATCIVIGGGTVAFYVINVLFDKSAD